MIMNACILSIFKYACPILIDANVNLQQKMNTLLIKCTRKILGFKSYKWNVTTIMREMKWYTYYQILMIEAVTFLHKCLYENLPISITNLLCYSLNRTQNIRKVRKVIVKEGTSSAKHSQTLIYRAVYLYNQLPSEIKGYHCKRFKKNAAQYLSSNYGNNLVPKNIIV